MKPYYVTFRAIIYAPSEVDAISWAEDTADEAKKTLIEDDGDDLYVTQITPYDAEVTPQETVTLLRQARNALVRTRVKECFDAARELDRISYMLEKRQTENGEIPDYDWGNFLEVAKQVLENGHGPINR